jgi:hypothetical protein
MPSAPQAKRLQSQRFRQIVEERSFSASFSSIANDVPVDRAG